MLTKSMTNKFHRLVGVPLPYIPYYYYDGVNLTQWFVFQEIPQKFSPILLMHELLLQFMYTLYMYMYLNLY